jgi:hypothetical protein
MKSITLIIPSPLSRLIQTVKTIFDGIALTKITYGHHEWLKDSGDVDCPSEALKMDSPVF